MRFLFPRSPVPTPSPPSPFTPASRQVSASLYILGRGNCFDNIAQLSSMRESVVCVRFHKLCMFFARDLYDAPVPLPTGEALDRVMLSYHKLGFTGVVRSTNAIHVTWACCRTLKLGLTQVRKGSLPPPFRSQLTTPVALWR